MNLYLKCEPSCAGSPASFKWADTEAAEPLPRLSSSRMRLHSSLEMDSVGSPVSFIFIINPNTEGVPGLPLTQGGGLI